MPDHVREAVFNLLRGHCPDGAVLDVFAGTGSIGLEALSRGAPRAVFVERDRRVAALIERNIDALGLADRSTVVIADALGPSAVARCPRPVHLIFMDPPYAMVRDPAGWDRVRAQLSRLMGFLDPAGYAIVRTPWPCVRRVGRAHEPTAHHDRRDHDEVLVDLQRDGIEAVRAFEAAARAGTLPGEHGTADDDHQADEPGSDHPTRYEPIDLAVDGAIGPETHPYGSTAVHLYMRRTDDSPVHPPDA